MDPEDVLDFGEEDEDDRDVISLGGSDHNGEPVTNSNQNNNHHSTRTGRFNKSPGPSKLSSNKISTHQTEKYSNNDPNDLSIKSSNDTKSATTKGSNISTDRSTSYNNLPPDKPSSARFTEAAQAHASAKNESRRSITSTNATNTTNTNTANPQRLSTSSIPNKTSSSDKSVPNQLSVPLDPTHPPLPKGWLVRISSRQGKTYYVNAITRTSQWHLPTEPASDVIPATTTKTTAKETMNKEPSTVTRRTVSNGTRSTKPEEIDASPNNKLPVTTNIDSCKDLSRKSITNSNHTIVNDDELIKSSRQTNLDYDSKERLVNDRRIDDDYRTRTGGDRTFDEPLSISSSSGHFHREQPPHHESRYIESSRRSRHPLDESPHRSRLRSISPPHRRFGSPIIEDHDRDRKYRDYGSAREVIPLGPSRDYIDDRMSVAQRSESGWHGSRYDHVRSIEESLPSSRLYDTRGVPYPPREPAAYRNASALRSVHRGHLSPSPSRYDDRRDYQREFYRRHSRSPSPPPRSRTREVYPARYTDERIDHGGRDVHTGRYADDRVIYERATYSGRYSEERVRRGSIEERDSLKAPSKNTSSSHFHPELDPPTGPKRSISGTVPPPPLSADQLRNKKRGQQSPSPPPEIISPKITNTESENKNKNKSSSLASRLGPVVNSNEIGNSNKRKRVNNHKEAIIIREDEEERKSEINDNSSSCRMQTSSRSSSSSPIKIMERVDNSNLEEKGKELKVKNHNIGIRAFQQHKEDNKISLKGRANNNISKVIELPKTVDEQLRPLLAIFDKSQPSSTSLMSRIQDLSNTTIVNTPLTTNNSKINNSLASRVGSVPLIKGGSLNDRLGRSPPTGPKHITERISGHIKSSNTSSNNRFRR
ncbi:hypothetical protein CROQUDRAFT_650054 [Cronartium quercuum f. sp. fusiforme G11]|uniref:WW domain-containing protein n=1 Tax=Cronartium quercuum f. sp. fusiforme G11 TaxID=708437 RepID=A0A9P6NVX1_9BASI|nr:hypothetical protein CROQUDRAFT_650054 [Cronartium quercuum f. sp. fusiforme G11]